MVEDIRKLVAQVEDPEIPTLTIEDLGILGDVRQEETGLVVEIMPTYTACPANDVITAEIRRVLEKAGCEKFEIRPRFDPPWTSDWITPEGRAKLKACNIALPERLADSKKSKALFARPTVPCPHCGASDTEMVSQFGSTLCKSSHKCLACREPFEAFKCH